MSTVKISELPLIPALNPDTTQTLVAGVDLVTGITGKMTTKVLASSLYSNDTLNVGNNSVILPNVVAQFAGSSNNYLQINLQNNGSNGSADYVITADTGTDSTYYIDMGYNNSTYNYSGYTYAKPLDGYLVVQGNQPSDPGGNLVIGTTTAGKDVSILVGSIDESKLMAKFIANTGFKMLQYPYHFADGSTQNTSAAPYATSNVGFARANSGFGVANNAASYANGAFITANSAGVFSNSAFQAANNVAATASSLSLTLLNTQNYTNGAYTLANTNATTLSATQSYANGAFTKANNALANTTGTFGGDLTIAGNTYANSVNTANLVVVGTADISGTVNMAGALNVVGAVAMNATVTLANSTFSATEAALTISASPSVVTPANDGYMIHISGKNGVASRIVTDSYGTGAYALYAGRAARGTVTSPTALQTGDVIARYSSSGYGATKYQALGTGRIDFVATENYTDSATGSQIQFWNCPNGSNTLTNIATFNGSSVAFTGVVNPQKGLVLTPNVISSIVNTLSIDIANNSLYYFKCNATTSISLSGYQTGKIVEVWMTNTDNNNHTVTHGCLANNSTVGSTTFSLTAGHSAFLRYFSIDGDQANTYVSINYS